MSHRGPIRGVVAHPGSRRKHAVEFIGAALDPDLTTESMRRTAHNIAHPIIAREKDSRGRPSDARRDQIIVDAIEAVCKVHDLRPTRMGQGECGCSIVATAIEEFIAGCHSPQLRELSRKLFPKGPLSEDSIKTIWKNRTKAN